MTLKRRKSRACCVSRSWTALPCRENTARISGVTECSAASLRAWENPSPPELLGFLSTVNPTCFQISPAKITLRRSGTILSCTAAVLISPGLPWSRRCGSSTIPNAACGSECSIAARVPHSAPHDCGRYPTSRRSSGLLSAFSMRLADNNSSFPSPGRSCIHSIFVSGGISSARRYIIDFRIYLHHVILHLIYFNSLFYFPYFVTQLKKVCI